MDTSRVSQMEGGLKQSPRGTTVRAEMKSRCWDRKMNIKIWVDIEETTGRGQNGGSLSSDHGSSKIKNKYKREL